MMEMPSGVNPFGAFTGDVRREVRDLEVWGGVGEHQLVWGRVGHSRVGSGAQWFGDGQGWRHSYQWELVDSGGGNLELYYPDGKVYSYWNNNGQWVGVAGDPDQLTQNGTDYILTRANGWQYHFVMVMDANGTYYQLQDFKDSQQNDYTLTYDSNRRLIQVTEPAGRYLQISYQDIDVAQTAFQNPQVNFTTLAQVNGTPAGSQWTELTVTDPNAYRYLRYYTGGTGSTNSWCNIAEMEFYDQNNVKLTGTPFGTGPSWGNNPDTTFAAATDGDVNTFFDYAYANNGYTGIDLGAGNAAVISKVRFYPRSGFEYRMNGGMFQGSNTNPLPQSVTLAQVNSTPASGQWTELTVTDPGTYRYLRYYTGGDSTNNTWSNVAEVEFYDVNNVKLTGTLFGTGPSWSNNPNTTFDKAFDGDVNTFFDYAYPHFGFTGIDLGAGNAVQVGKVRFYPRLGFEGRMNGGMFQGSNSAPITRTVIAQVTTSDGRNVSYSYGTIADTILDTNWLVLNHAVYGDSTQATYNYVQVWPGQAPLMWEATDSRLSGTAVHMKYEYWVNSWVYGAIYAEHDGDNEQIVATLTGSGDWGASTSNVTYANGAVHANTFSSNGKPIQRIDGLGRTTNLQYGPNNDAFLTQSTDALGRVTNYTNSAAGNPLTITNPDSSTRIWTRDSLDLPLTLTDELGRVTTYTRDANHRVTRITYPDNNFETFTYNGFGEVLTHTTRNGGAESFTYDARGLKLSSTDALNNVTTYTYDAADRLASVTDARSNTTSYAYNERGLLTQVTNPDNSTITYGYDSFGNQASMTNELGKNWAIAYDEYRRVTSKTDPLNRTTQISYALPGVGGCGSCVTQDKPTQITLPSGKMTTITYDLEWQTTSKTVGTGTADAATASYGYDLVGNLTNTTDPLGNVWTYAYDNRNRKITATDPLGHTTQWTYDAVSNNLTATRPDNGVMTNQYDAMNRLIQTADPKNQVTEYAYDNEGNLVTLTDANNHAYSFTYDLLNRKLTMKYPDNSQESWAYDAVSNVATYTARAGQVRTYSYDNRNRQTASIWNDSTPAIATTYDVASRLLTMTSNVSALTYAYDDANERLGETQAIAADGGAKTVSYAYDADGNRATLTYPDNTQLSYAYTNRNRLSGITSGATIVSYTYDLNGNRLSKNLANNTGVNYTYDVASRLLTMDNTKGGVSFSRFDYTFNAVTDHTSKTQTDAGVPVHVENYTYDTVDQVTGATYADNAVINRTVNYGLDPVGNRTSVTDNNVATNYTANNLNQYTAVGTDTPTYDTNGNLLAQGGWTYTYDAQNRLTSASNGTTNATFVYDPLNRRVTQTINGTTTFFCFDGWNLIEERNTSDAQLARYLNGAQEDEILTRVTPTAASYYHHDALGNTSHLTDVSGNIVEKYRYDIFGGVIILAADSSVLSSSALGNRFLFTGREYLVDLNLYDYRNRMYSQGLGRFLQIDPIQFASSDINLYRYVENGPVNWVDLFGLYQKMPPFAPKLPIWTRPGNQNCLDYVCNWQTGQPGDAPSSRLDPNADTTNCKAMKKATLQITFPNSTVPIFSEPNATGCCPPNTHKVMFGVSPHSGYHFIRYVPERPDAGWWGKPGALPPERTDPGASLWGNTWTPCPQQMLCAQDY